MKYPPAAGCPGGLGRPLVGAWIEIQRAAWLLWRGGSSPPSRGAWIEIANRQRPDDRLASPPSRGAWIEMQEAVQNAFNGIMVAPLAGGVD